jgi:hypothetical protein
MRILLLIIDSFVNIDNDLLISEIFESCKYANRAGVANPLIHIEGKERMIDDMTQKC